MAADEYIQIPAEAMPELRRMLAIGMAACAEIERLQTELALGGKHWPEAQRAVNPSGGCTLSEFASALMSLDCAVPAGRA